VNATFKGTQAALDRNGYVCKTAHEAQLIARQITQEGHWGGRGCRWGVFNHTDAAGSHVSGNHDGALAHLELVEHPVALVLLLVTVDGERWPAVLAKEAGDFVGDTLGAGEDEDLAGLVLHDLLDVPEHLVALLELGDNLDLLGDAVVGGKLHGTDGDLDPVGLVVGGKLANLLGPGSRPHAGLTVRANLADDLADLGLETHVEHAVSLIEDKVGNALEVSLAHLEHVDQTTGSSDADLNTLGKVTDLLALGHTTVDAGVPDAGRLAELADFLLDLDSQLTGGSEDEDDGSVTGCEERLSVDVDDSGKTVTKGLSGTSLGNTNDVATGEGHGPALRLNGSGLSEASGLDLVHDVSGETSLVEGLDGSGDVGTGEGHGVVGTELVDIGLGARSDGRVLLVEGLLELGKGVDVVVLLLEASAELAHPVAAAATESAAATATATAVATATRVAAVASAVGVTAAAVSVK
jgi:hypothetical protein